MQYLYIIKSIKTKKIYIGYTSDLKRRLKEHNEGKNYTTYEDVAYRISLL